MNAENCGCGKTVASRSSLYRHVRIFHGGDYDGFILDGKGKPPTRPTEIGRKCPSCGSYSKNMEELCTHIQSSHNVQLNYLKLEFDNVSDFDAWLVEEERKSFSQFIRRKGGQQRLCHRSGFYEPTSATGKRKRIIKNFLSNKIDAVCPAYLKLTNSGEKVEVLYQSVHFGHETEPGSLNNIQSDKDELAAKLASGIPKERILADLAQPITRNAPSDGEDTDDADEAFRAHSRLQLTTMKDLNNIISQYGIMAPSSIKCHNNDTISVGTWVAEEQQKAYSRVIFYKAQGEVDEEHGLGNDEFLLAIQTKEQRKMIQDFGHDRICVDGTHGTTGYGFILTTLMVVDEFNEGYPVAHCLSSKEDTKVMLAFMKSVKRNSGQIECKTFMSDDAGTYRNAWREVMGPPLHTLLCTWHVKNAWQGHLNSIKNDVKRNKAYTDLRKCTKLLDRDEFHLNFISLRAEWGQDKELADFLDYIETYYAHRVEMWAYAYRIGCRINVNMRLENYHSQLKNKCLLGKKSKRVDNCISAILQFLDGKVRDRMIKINRGKHSHRTAKILSRHQEGLLLATDEIVKYPVKIKDSHGMCSLKCGLHCPYCAVCYYAAECGCYDYLVDGNICKHIHGVASKLQRTLIRTRATPLPPPKNPSSAGKLAEEVVSLDSEIREIMKCKIPGATDVTFLKAVKSQQIALKRLISSYKSPLSLECNLKLTPESQKEPANKKAEKQPRYYSITKKKLKKKLNSMPTASTSALASITDSSGNNCAPTFYYDHLNLDGNSTPLVRKYVFPCRNYSRTLKLPSC